MKVISQCDIAFSILRNFLALQHNIFDPLQLAARSVPLRQIRHDAEQRKILKNVLLRLLICEHNAKHLPHSNEHVWAQSSDRHLLPGSKHVARWQLCRAFKTVDGGPARFFIGLATFWHWRLGNDKVAQKTCQ